MAWRPSKHLIDGELDNTVSGKVTGWMRFAGLKGKVTFDLQGDFHRDVRETKIRFKGEGCEDDPEAAAYMDGMELRQTGKVGDMTGGREPFDYCDYPYIEWYSEQNGRIVIELEPNQIDVIGTPIPFVESDPISRNEQRRNMAEFLGQVSANAGVMAIAIGRKPAIVSDPAFSHWVVESGRIIGEARSVRPADDARSFAFVRLFSMPDDAEFGYIATKQLQIKNGQAPA